ncbi:hypothetical protein GQ53DRAFT_242969 [Thozetella sp. PMI_491]|nr:hypothetical protein GQ53DRAFT_242969 [Thozetella sp. PMI_491]
MCCISLPNRRTKTRAMVGSSRKLRKGMNPVGDRKLLWSSAQAFFHATFAKSIRLAASVWTLMTHTRESTGKQSCEDRPRTIWRTGLDWLWAFCCIGRKRCLPQPTGCCPISFQDRSRAAAASFLFAGQLHHWAPIYPSLFFFKVDLMGMHCAMPHHSNAVLAGGKEGGRK